MICRNGCQDRANTRPRFLVIYATVIAGIVLSSLYIFSAVYSSSNYVFYSSSSFFPSSSSKFIDSDSTRIKDQGPNVTRPSTSPTPDFRSTDVHNKEEKPIDVHNKGETSIWVAPNSNTMPPLEAFRLSKELVLGRAKDNIIIVTFGNYAFMGFILGWVKHLTDLGLSNFLVGAMDTKLLEALYWKDIPVFDMGSNMSTLDVGWGSPTFHKMGREKVMLIDTILPYGVELLMCDTDMVWLKNPLPYLARYPEADILTSSDQIAPTVIDDSLDIWNQVHRDLNIGIFHWRPTEASKKLAKEWREILQADDLIWDQYGFNVLVHRKYGPSVDEDSGLVYAYDGTLKLGILPASIYCSGHTYFVQATFQQFRLEPYAVHTTFQFAGTEGKRHRLREAMVFYDPPEYFDAPGGYLSFKPSIPKNLILEGEHNIDTHFALINYQMKQIRTALAIASLLNRTLIMPLLWCRLDRLWFPHPGVLKGSVTPQPFICPLDHVFEVNVMLKELAEEEFGPGINFREYSFLENPLLPKQVKESWLDVHLCKQESDDCHASNDTVRPGVLKFPKGSNEDTFKATFSTFKDVKVIQFSTMQDAFPGFSDKKKEEKFRNRVKRYVGLWCCLENVTPGHIFYDMYWDEKPDWKPLPPRTLEEDRPPL